MDILIENNIIKCDSIISKNKAISELCKVLHESGYVKKEFEDSVMSKEKEFDTAIGFGLAIPHAMIDDKDDTIINTGLAIMALPQGISWNGKVVKFVVMIAANGDEHIEILSKIAIMCSSEEAVDRLCKLSENEIYTMLAK